MAIKGPPKVSSGSEGLDRVLNGGLAERRLYLVQGGPGTGKTTLALQFLMAGVANKEKVLYVTLSQSAEELAEIARSHGWSLKGIEIEELNIAEAGGEADEQTIFVGADIRLDRTRTSIEAAVERLKPTRLVYDSLLEVRKLTEDTERLHRELLGFKALLQRKGITAYMIDVLPEEGGDSTFASVAHGIIRLDYWMPEYGSARRRVDIQKMRGIGFHSGHHDAAIRTGTGLEVFPRTLPAVEVGEAEPALIKSGIEDLDAMLGGGMEAGTTTLIIGQSGTGKSTMASLYAEAALKRGDGVSLFLFEEREETFFRRSEGLGIKLRGYRKKGLLELFDFDPAEISPGEFAQIVLGSVAANKSRVVLIDSFTGYLNALPRTGQIVHQIQTLLKHLSRCGVLTIVIVAQHGLLGHEMDTDVDLSFLGDTVLFLRMYEWPAVIRRTIAVVKKRHGPHDLDVRELQIETTGVRINPFNPPPPGAPSPQAS